jgi:hypothetical protein
MKALGSEVEPIKIRSNRTDTPVLDYFIVHLFYFVRELTAAWQKVNIVGVKMESAVCKQAHSGLIGLARAVFVQD